MAKFSVGGEEDGEGPSSTSNPRPKRPRLHLDVVENQLLTRDPQPPIAVDEEENDAEEEDDDEEEEEEDEEEDGSEHEDDEEEDVDIESVTAAEEEEDDDADPTPPQQMQNPAQVQTQRRNSVGPRSSAVSAGSNLGARASAGSSRDGSVVVTLTDPEVLDCSICYDSLSPPVYQCENGHIACSSCCTKIRNKCPSCAWPIGYNRCRAIEKVIESVRISCQNSKYGCIETLIYSKRSEHENTCIHAPCSCPHADCSFLGSSRQLSLHFSSKHSNAATRFRYSLRFSVCMKVTEKFLILQEMVEGTLFIINNGIEVLGNVVTISCIGPSTSKGGFFYEVTVKGDGSSVKLESSAKVIQRRVDNTPEKGFLMVPCDFSGSTGYLTLYICICSAGSSYMYLPRNAGVRPSLL